MADKLTNIVIWKPRATPGKRVIPPHLKLAILSRGRIQLPTSRMEWLVDVARSAGATWPDDLTRPLEQIVPELSITIELFRKQRPSLTSAEISQSLSAYLELRRRAHLSGCLFLLFSWTPHTGRRQLERSLDLDLSRLFVRPRVFAQPRADDPYILVTYACIPTRVRQFIKARDTKPGPPRPLADLKPPLHAMTTSNAEMVVRTGPSTSAASLGEQDGHSVPVSVIDKHQAEGYSWFQITFRQDMRVKRGPKPVVAAGTTAWIVRDGFELVAAPWVLFRHQLIALENTLAQETPFTKITRLRQLTHKRDLPFDSVIGSDQSDLYLDDVPDNPGTWQMAKDYNAVVAPDGRFVDVNHLLVGLDVLRRQEVSAYFMDIYVGNSWAAATWSGDVGSAVADMQLHVDRNWEKRNPSADSYARAEHYFSTRTSEWDLLGDIDPWELIHGTKPPGATVDDLLAAFYERTTPGVVRELTRDRAAAIERFLLKYGFQYDVATDFTEYPALIKQREAMRRVIQEVRSFAHIWILYRLYTRSSGLIDKLAAVYKASGDEATPDNAIVTSMAVQFAYWLECAAIENGVTAAP